MLRNYNSRQCGSAMFSVIRKTLVPLSARALISLYFLTCLSGCSPIEYSIAHYETDVDGIQIIVTDVNECDVTRQISGYLQTQETKHGPFVISYLECGRSFDKDKYEVVSNDQFIVFRRLGSRHAKFVFDKVGKFVVKLDNLPEDVDHLLEEGPLSDD